jgi:D-alanyl-D-alanine carboxypeptidase (penicillin-binding protein 5/6)
LILAAALGAALAAAPAPPPVDRFPNAASSYVVAIDGTIVWERNADRPMPPASLTKIMTALVLVEGAWDPEAEVKVSAHAAAETGSRAGLRAGETLAARELFKAMLVASANDACLALAEHAGPGDSTFVARMNDRARAMGLTATRFANPCGHDDREQRSSAHDLRRIADAAMAHAEIAGVVSMRETTIVTRKGRKIFVKTGNQLLGRSPGVYGIKSGYTEGAGKCVVAAAERERTKVLIVLLNAPDRWWTAAGLLEAAFNEAHPKP